MIFTTDSLRLSDRLREKANIATKAPAEYPLETYRCPEEKTCTHALTIPNEKEEKTLATSLTQQQTPQEIFAAIEQLEPEEADRLALSLLQLQARRKAPHLSEREAELLAEIYSQKRIGFEDRYEELNQKRRNFSLMQDEHAELLELCDESEAFTLRRLKALIELAQLRRTKLPVLMKQLGLKAPSVV